MIVGCNSNEHEFRGYYSNQEKFQIYFFDKTEVDIFNFSDSTISKVKYDIERDIIKIKNEIYKYNKINDTLFLNNFSEDGKNLKLLKFDFKPFNLKEIVSKSFRSTYERIDRESNRPYKEEQFLKLDKRKGIKFFYNNKNNSDTIYGGYIVYKGKVFNRFPFFRGHLGNSFILCGYNNEISLLSFSSKSIFTLTEFKPRNSLNILLSGKWKQIEDNYNIDIFKQYAYSYPTPSNYLDYKNKVEQIKKEYDFSDIEFLKNGILQRYFQNDTTLSHQIEFGITNKYIFVEKFYNEKDFGVLEVEKLTKDTLVLSIFDSQIHYKYIRNN